MTDLQDALDVMTSTYLPFDFVVRGMVLDANKVAQALADVDLDTPEHTVLLYLSKKFPETE
tara:strand:+ start:1129 stop:1311 length:183 start_codon:yes stop_codon:yes gene_type:complete